MILCLIGTGFTQLSAQNENKDNGNKAVSSWVEVPRWIVDVYCDDQHVDFVEGSGWVHFVTKNKGEELIWERVNTHMTAESTSGSGEVFKYIEIGFIPKNSLEPGEIYEEQLNYQLIGNQGNHYVGKLTVKVWLIPVEPYINIEFIPGKNNHCL
jgi:hypothetical protein